MKVQQMLKILHSNSILYVLGPHANIMTLLTIPNRVLWISLSFKNVCLIVPSLCKLLFWICLFIHTLFTLSFFNAIVFSDNLGY